MGSFWDETRVLVTGGAGFIGSHVVDRLVELGATVRVVDNFSHGSMANLANSIDKVELARTDLTDLASCRKVCEGIDVVLALAARVAGIQFNQSHSADMFQTNSRISLNMLEAARVADVERYLVVSSACVYRRNCSIPTAETEGFLDDPEPTNWGYGWAKRFAEIQGIAFSRQYGMKIGIARPYNTYGPRDHFYTNDGHVIPSLITKIISGVDPVVVWGTGSQTRSFIFVKDLVQGMLLNIEKYPIPDPVNLGSTEEISIADLVGLITKTLARRVRITFDKNEPEGQQRRAPDVSKAKETLGFTANTSLEDGLAHTVNWLFSLDKLDLGLRVSLRPA